jgi:hypothetical protein
MSRIGASCGSSHDSHGRSGGAAGADIAFETGFRSTRGSFAVFRPRPLATMRAEMDLFDREVRPIAGAHMPSIFGMSAGNAGLLARNMNQVLGADLRSPCDFVVCWTPTLDYRSREAGGTRYACLLAQARGIPIFNIADSEQFDSLLKIVYNSP